MAPMTGEALRAGVEAFNTGFSFGVVIGAAVMLAGVTMFARWRNR